MMPRTSLLSLLTLTAAAFLLAWTAPVPDSQQPAPQKPVVLDDFESYQVRGLPTRWKFIDSRQKLLPVNPSIMSEEEFFIVLQEDHNKFLRAVTNDRAHRLILTDDDLGTWDLRRHPYLRWDWRARQLPARAREDREALNDTGGAIYVTFSRDWLGRPRSIKYTYSTTLPAGTVVSFGSRLKVVVVSSGKDGIGRWIHVERDVAADYRNLFGGEPPESPVSIMLWSDSNSVHDRSEVDFDNFAVAAANHPSF